jgi:hypothetical protein
MLYKMAQQAGAAAWRHSDGRPALRGAYSIVALGLVGLIAWTWLPNGDYAPIREGETWNLKTGLASFRHAGSGKPGLTVADPKAAEEPFAATPTGGSGLTSPSDVLDDESGDTQETDDLSDPDPETDDDPFFDPAPSPASSGLQPTSAPASAAPSEAPVTSAAPSAAPEATP